MKKIIIPVAIIAILVNSCGSKNEGSTYYDVPETENLNSDNYESLEEDMVYVKDESPSEGYGYASEETDGSLTASVTYSNKSQNNISGNTNGNSQSLKTDDLKSGNVFNAKIIRNAELKFKVDNVKSTSAKIANLVDLNGGYISSEDLLSDRTFYQTIERTEESETIEYEVNTSNIIYIRVPSNNFQKLLSSMKGLAISEDYVKINAQDVTEEYFDLETRLKTKKEVEARYIDILKSKAKTLDEILIAEDKIRVIREEIEAVEGRLNYLKNKVSLSTIQVEIYQPTYYTQETTRFKAFENTKTGWSFTDKAGDAIGSGWDGILIFLVGLLYFWPLWLIGGGLFWIIRKKIRQRKSDKTTIKKGE